MRTLSFFLLFVAFTSCCHSKSDNNNLVPQQFIVNFDENTSGFDVERLQRIDSVMARYVREGVAPNFVSFIARNGKVVHNKAYGYSDAENGVAVKTTDIFRLASQTKAITTAVLLTLLEENMLLLDDPIERYLPMFANPQVYVSGSAGNGDLVTRPASRSITVRHLLAHTAGYSYNAFGEDLRVINYAERVTTKEIVERIARTPLMHDPGENYTYGFNTDIAGYLAEVITGKTLDVLMRERIFEPLEMNDTYFYLPQDKHDRLVKLYVRPSNNARYSLDPSEVDQYYPFAADQPFHGGGAGLCGTIEDYAKFCQMLLNGGVFNNRRILGAKTVELMFADHHLDIPGDYKFSLGFEIGTESLFARDLRSLGSLSWGGAYGTSFLIDTQENMIILLYTNVRNWNNPMVRDRFLISVYQALNGE